MTTPTRRNSPSSAIWRIAGGTRTASSGRCTRSIRCGSTGSTALRRLGGKRVLDVGCGGGILADSMARRGADVLGIDLADEAAQGGAAACAGSRHAERRVPRGRGRGAGRRAAGAASMWSPAWRCSSTCPIRPPSCAPARPWSSRAAGCSSRPSTAIPRRSCSRSSAPNTCCNLLPQGTHEYAQASSGRASWPRWCRAAGLELVDTRGMEYNPLTRALLAVRRHQRQLPVRLSQGRDDARRSRAVLFDLDGTLIDSAPDLAGAGNELRAARGLPPLPFEAFRPMVGIGRARHGRRRLRHRTRSDAGFADAARRVPRALRSAHDCAIRASSMAMLPVLEALEARGVPWGIVTNKATRFTRR